MPTASAGWRVRRDGTRFWANVVITAIKDADGRLTGFGKVTRDLTEHREAEQRLRAVNAELDAFTAMAAHDLQDPLRTVSGVAQLLLARHAGTLPEEGRRYLRHIGAASGRMNRLVDELLTFARVGRPCGGSQPRTRSSTAPAWIPRSCCRTWWPTRSGSGGTSGSATTATSSAGA